MIFICHSLMMYEIEHLLIRLFAIWVSSLVRYLSSSFVHFLVRVFVFFFFFLSFWPQGAACGILVPRPGIEPGHSSMRARSPNHWMAREFPGCSCSYCSILRALCVFRIAVLYQILSENILQIFAPSLWLVSFS